MNKIKINGQTYVSEKVVDELKEEMKIYDKLLKWFCPFSEDEYATFDDRPQDIKYLTKKYKRIGKIAKKSRADYELEIRDLKAELGAIKGELNKARNNGIKTRYGDGFVSLLKRLKDELNRIDFDNMTGSMDL